MIGWPLKGGQDHVTTTSIVTTSTSTSRTSTSTSTTIITTASTSTTGTTVAVAALHFFVRGVHHSALSSYFR